MGDQPAVEVATDGVVTGLVRRDELKEVLVNLVENGRNARATKITLAVGEGPRDTARVSVTDNGQGIPPEDLPRIFEPRFSTTTSGTGLGLAICKRLIETWGGSIAVESMVGKGTTVTVEIPGSRERGAV